MNKVTWIIFSVFSVLLLFGLVLISNNQKINVSDVDTNAIQVASDQNGNIADHVYGNTDSDITLVSYADYQCPGCASQHPNTKDLVEKYKDKIRFVFRNFPLTTIHPNAKAAAGAAEAAGLQGKFWEMHDLLYERQSEWESLTSGTRNTKFDEFAKDLGLDTEKFESDMASKAINDKINFDSSLARQAKIEATPSFVLNGTLLESSTWGDSTKFEDAIKAEIEKSNNN